MLNGFGEKKFIAKDISIVGGFNACVAACCEFLVELLIAVIFFTATSLVRPALNTLLSKMAGDEQGFVAGMNKYMSIGNMIGPALAGILFDINVNVPYILAPSFFLLVMSWLLHGKAVEQVLPDPSQLEINSVLL